MPKNAMFKIRKGVQIERKRKKQEKKNPHKTQAGKYTLEIKC